MPYHLHQSDQHHLNSYNGKDKALQSQNTTNRFCVLRLYSWSKGKQAQQTPSTQQQARHQQQTSSTYTEQIFGSLSPSSQHGCHAAKCLSDLKFKLTDQHQWPAMEAAQRFRAMSEVIGVSLAHVNDEQGVAVLWVQVRLQSLSVQVLSSYSIHVRIILQLLDVMSVQRLLPHD